MDDITASEIMAREAKFEKELREKYEAMYAPLAQAIRKIELKALAVSLPTPFTAKPFT